MHPGRNTTRMLTVKYLDSTRPFPRDILPDPPRRMPSLENMSFTCHTDGSTSWGIKPIWYRASEEPNQKGITKRYRTSEVSNQRDLHLDPIGRLVTTLPSLMIPLANSLGLFRIVTSSSGFDREQCRSAKAPSAIHTILPSIFKTFAISHQPHQP